MIQYTSQYQAQIDAFASLYQLKLNPDTAIPGLAKTVEGAYFCYYGMDCKKT
jgi:hypothetical protein